MWDASKCDLCGECLTRRLYVEYDRVLRKPAAARGLTKIYVTHLCRMALGEIPFPAA
jgi:hypothetical protein